MKVNPSDLERIEHMIGAINSIFEYTEDLGYADFLNQKNGARRGY